MLRLNFHVISIFCLLRLHRALYKIHMWKLFDYGKIKNWKKVLGKERKKNRSKEERKSTILSRKEKNSFVKATSAGWAPRWRPDFKQRSRRQTKMCRTYTQIIFRFFHFCRGFCLRLWQLCSLLCSPPQRSTERSKKKKRCLKSGAHYLCIGNGFLLQWVTFSGKSWSIIFDARRSRCLVGLGRNDLLAWRESFANVYELKSHIWFEKEYNHFGRIYRVYRSVWFSSNFTKTFQE